MATVKELYEMLITDGKGMDKKEALGLISDIITNLTASDELVDLSIEQGYCPWCHEPTYLDRTETTRCSAKGCGWEE